MQELYTIYAYSQAIILETKAKCKDIVNKRIEYARTIDNNFITG